MISVAEPIPSRFRPPQLAARDQMMEGLQAKQRERQQKVKALILQLEVWHACFSLLGLLFFILFFIAPFVCI